jgi:hypothetical protein
LEQLRSMIEEYCMLGVMSLYDNGSHIVIEGI